MTLQKVYQSDALNLSGLLTNQHIWNQEDVTAVVVKVKLKLKFFIINLILLVISREYFKQPVIIQIFWISNREMPVYFTHFWIRHC